MPHGWLSPRGRVPEGAGVGVLTWVIPPGLAGADGLAWEMRLRGLPARVAVYFTLGPGRVFARAVKRPLSGFPMQRQPLAVPPP